MAPIASSRSCLFRGTPLAARGGRLERPAVHGSALTTSRSQAPRLWPVRSGGGAGGVLALSISLSKHAPEADGQSPPLHLGRKKNVSARAK